MTSQFDMPVTENRGWPMHRLLIILRLAVTVVLIHLGGGLVTNCTEMALANKRGNFGPPVPDFDEAEIRIAIFGDSFTGASVTGPAWTQMMGEKLERELGKTVRVLNMGRDAYGMSPSRTPS
jgi:hypothetical protein